MDLVSVCAVGVANGLVGVCGVTQAAGKLPDTAAWEDLLTEGIHMLKVNQQAELSAQPLTPFQTFAFAARIMSVAARDQTRHESLLASGAVDPLLYMTAHSKVFIGVALNEQSAAATIALIGRNIYYSLSSLLLHQGLDIPCMHISSPHPL